VTEPKIVKDRDTRYRTSLFIYLFFWSSH